MRYAIAFGLASATVVLAAPNGRRQLVGGGLEGFVPDASGFLEGVAGLFPEPFATGELGGAATAPAGLKDRQLVGGGLEGFVPDASGFLEGVAGLFPQPFATGELGGAATAPADLKERQLFGTGVIASGAGSGFAPGVTGFLEGVAGLLPEPFATGELGGAATAPAGLKDRQLVGGGLEGFVPDASGFLEGIAGLFPEPFATGELGGAATAPADLKERQLFGTGVLASGALSGFAPDASGFLEGVAGLFPEPFATGELGGAATAPASLEERAPQGSSGPVGGQVGGSVSSGPAGFVGGIVGSSTLFGCVGGQLPQEFGGLGFTLCGRDAMPTPPPAGPAAL